MQRVRDARSIEGEPRGFDLWLSVDGLCIRGMYQTGTHGPPICLPLAPLRRALVAQRRFSGRSGGRYRARRFAFDPRGRETSLHVLDYSADGFQWLYATTRLVDAIDRETRTRR